MKNVKEAIYAYISMDISTLLICNQKKSPMSEVILNINIEFSYVAYPNTILAVTFNASKIGMVSS